MNDTEFASALRPALMDAQAQEVRLAIEDLGDEPVRYSRRYRRWEKELLKGRVIKSGRNTDPRLSENFAETTRPCRHLHHSMIVAAIVLAVLTASFITVSARNPAWWQMFIR